MTREAIQAIYFYIKFSFVESELSTVLKSGEKRNLTIILETVNSLKDVFSDAFDNKKLSIFEEKIFKTAVLLYNRLSEDKFIPKNFKYDQLHLDQSYSKNMDRFFKLLMFIATELKIDNQLYLNAFKDIYSYPKIKGKKIEEFTGEYESFFEMFQLFDSIEAEKSIKLSIQPALLEFHQGLTHLSRFFNFEDKDRKEFTRFKSHIRRATLDIAKISIEQLIVKFNSNQQMDAVFELRKKSMLIKSYEVVSIPSNNMEHLLAKYKSCIVRFNAKL